MERNHFSWFYSFCLSVSVSEYIVRLPFPETGKGTGLSLPTGRQALQVLAPARLCLRSCGLSAAIPAVGVIMVDGDTDPVLTNTRIARVILPDLQYL
jgi:hypothetical protein